MHAIEKTQAVLTLNGALRVLSLSSSRYHEWRDNERRCDLNDHDSFPHSKSTRLTADEVLAMKSMLELAEYRHVPTGRLAILAQRLGKVFAASATWYRLARERGWRRPRNRVYPVALKDGLRASKPNEYWHIDVRRVAAWQECHSPLVSG